MGIHKMWAMQADAEDPGRLQIRVTTAAGAKPIAGARVRIYYTGEPENEIMEVTTDESGQTEALALEAPPLEYSVNFSEQQPYAEYTVEVSADGFEPVEVAGTEILPEVTAIQEIRMRQQEPGEEFQRYVIGPHTLFGDYPPKIAEAEIKPTGQSGEIVLSRVVVPEYIIVHDGVPTDSTATNYWVRYKDYIKNVASSEIYATWTDAAIRANILAIMSFTLNRVYTEWYRNKGYEFTITSSTAFDHKWINGRNIFENISRIVDEMFGNYLSRPNVKQPILTQYCDGQRVSCPNWMSQWGSQSLGEQGYTAAEILRYYYGDSIYINTAEQISGVPYSWPGSDLAVGSSGQKVLQMQEQLNAIARNYPAIPRIAEDGIFGPATKAAVSTFQSIFGLPANGVVDYTTWYKISEIYVAVTRIAELN
ncbi:MAG: peptidoglycan-binding protein [Lachnospiraceae bacterium]|nr:peptidoglycan-binding protein [Lachnospiraceae bacterium]MCI8994570.1 peptidoglycan-binding protein [Lachnospiraceae bacterium]MCI9135549.1 peptidoglycan-binding protein [Lachnospiraceae bacterium]